MINAANKEIIYIYLFFVQEKNLLKLRENKFTLLKRSLFIRIKNGLDNRIEKKKVQSLIRINLLLLKKKIR